MVCTVAITGLPGHLEAHRDRVSAYVSSFQFGLPYQVFGFVVLFGERAVPQILAPGNVSRMRSIVTLRL